MRLEKALKKIEKRLGVKPVEVYNGKYSVQVGNYVGSFLTQQDYGEDANGKYGPIEGAKDALNWHIRRHDDHTDSMTDYFAGSFRDNCTQWLNALQPPAPKFPIGCLVRGKQNKRATRMGYAGKTGLVVDTGNYVKVNWLGEEPSPYNNFPQRDLELVSNVA